MLNCLEWNACDAWLTRVRSKGSLGHAFTVRIRTANQNQKSFYPSVPHEISVLVELILGHLRYLLTDVPPQPNSPPDNVFRPDRPAERALGKASEGTVPSPSPGRHAATRSRHGSSSSSPPTADGFGTGTPIPSPQSQSFTQTYEPRHRTTKRGSHGTRGRRFDSPGARNARGEGRSIKLDNAWALSMQHRKPTSSKPTLCLPHDRDGRRVRTSLLEQGSNLTARAEYNSRAVRPNAPSMRAQHRPQRPAIDAVRCCPCGRCKAKASPA
ncbi:Regulator of rDNA transcription protein 15 [Capsicum baccatum]|uniref:Regulator of rDNA transcription protein 15 n=1 Tax=Capsicum baccatum TaxID=33114 RepID=A0A2G2V316_CAPBA|nr:Regulator of rDNA transcription protein 15 [Capsicum baccatum]